MRDYTDSSGDAEDRNIAFLKPYVWDCMHFDHIYSGNFRYSWQIDPISGVMQIVSFVAHAVNDDETYDELEAIRWIHRECNTPEEHHLRLQGNCFSNCVYSAILQLVDEGRVEIALEYGWPSVRLTMANLPPQIIGGSATFNDRETKMRARVEELRTMPYPDYLKSEEWRWRREIHIEAAGGRCQLCNSDEQPLHVHHRTYANRGREKFYDLVALCAPCHEMFHLSGRKVR